MVRFFSTIGVFLFIVSFSQNKKIKTEKIEWNCYLPNGEKCDVDFSKKMTVGELNHKFEKHGRIWDAYILEEQAVVNYKSFTSQPLYVLILNNKKYSSDKISEIIKSVNDDNSSYSYYFGTNAYGHHWGLKSDIKRFIEKNILDKDFVLSTLGTPSEIKDSLYGGSPTKCFTYKDIGIRIYFIDEQAVGYDEF